jgi:hypothetical protein
MIPGIGTAIGMGLSAVGGLASMAGDMKEKKDMQAEMQEQQPTQGGAAAAPLQDNSRPGQKQLEAANPQTPLPPQSNVYNPQQQATGLGGYQGQLDLAIANLITGGDRNPLGGP